MCWCNLESGLGLEGARLWPMAATATGDGCSDDRCGSGRRQRLCARWLRALEKAAVAQETRAQARACGCVAAAVAVLGRCGHDYWRLKLRLLEAQGFGGNWYEGVWSCPSPFYKPVEQLNGLGTRRVTILLL